MSLTEKISSDLINAMKAKDKVVLEARVLSPAEAG